MKHKKVLSIVLAAATAAALLSGCGSLFGNGGASSAPAKSTALESSQAAGSTVQQASSTPAQSVAPSAQTASSGAGGTDEPSVSQPGPVGEIKTDDKAFNQKFAKNPIDKAYIEASVQAVSNLDMVNTANKFAQVWAGEVTSAYDKAVKLAKGTQLDQIRADQNDWLTEKPAALKKISSDAQTAGGSMAKVTEATAIMNFYRSRAAEVYQQLYAYDANYTYAYGK